MERYDSYKPSGISWIGEIPSHWEELKAKYLFLRHNRPVQEKDEVVTCFRDGQVTLRKNRRTTGFTESLQECGYQGIRKGDLVFHQMDAFAGASGISDSDGKSTPVYIVCTPAQDFIFNPFYGYVVRYMGLNGYIKSLYRGIRERSSNFNYDVFSQQYLPIPPLDEQKKIVEFLSTKTSQIDAQQRERERELRLLDELKQAEIANVVTRGLNPNVPMKDSGIPWIGQIPAHWEVKRLGSLFHDKISTNSDYKFQRAYKFNYGTLVPKEETGDIAELKETYIKYSVLQPFDIVINGLNLNYDFVSKRVAISPADCIITSAYLVLRPRPNTFAEYFVQLFKAMDSQKLFHGMGTGIRLTLSFNELKSQYLPIPPLEEQRAIVDFIMQKNAAIDEMIANLRAEIDFLTEYKQRLIADVVTGQVNVQHL